MSTVKKGTFDPMPPGRVTCLAQWMAMLKCMLLLRVARSRRVIETLAPYRLTFQRPRQRPMRA
eukprot:6455078-Amphidinium_carterae.2